MNSKVKSAGRLERALSLDAFHRQRAGHDKGTTVFARRAIRLRGRSIIKPGWQARFQELADDL